MDCRYRDHGGIDKFVHGSDVDSAIWRIFILRFGFPNILLLLCVGIFMNVCIFINKLFLSDSY